MKQEIKDWRNVREFIAFLDVDDYWHPENLNKLNYSKILTQVFCTNSWNINERIKGKIN